MTQVSALQIIQPRLPKNYTPYLCCRPTVLTRQVRKSAYLDIVSRSLKQDGVAVIQAITIQDKYFESYSRGTDFVQQYIFPGGMLLSNNKLRSLASHVRLEVLDLFEFGKDYARTLNEWDKNFMKKIEVAKKIGFDDRFIRLWRFYFHYCEAGFLSERINVCQITVRK